MKALAEKRSMPQRTTSRWLRRIVCFCAAALCFSSVAAQNDADVREKVHQIEELRNAGKFQEAVPIAEEVLKYCEKNYGPDHAETDRKSTRLNSSYLGISYAVFCLK